MGAVRVIFSFLRTFAAFIKQPFRGVVTVQYPRVQYTPPARFRGGTFALTYDEEGEENCIGCKLCAQICPSRIIEVTLQRDEGRSRAGVFTLDYEACMQCELCVQVCPTDAIVMTQQRQPIATRREDLFLSREQLFANGKALSPVWAAGNPLREMQGGKRLK